MTIYHTLLRKGYFAKELPPAFSTEQFAAYARTKTGRSVLDDYKPRDKFTQCTEYQLALPGLERRRLTLPHPASFAKLAALTSQNLKRLLTLASSPFSKSRPVYATTRHRAISPSVKPSNLARERAAARAGASYVLRVDVSQFYPSLYTHAVGWAVDPKLRKKAHWRNDKLLGKQLDQALLNLQGKVSQGVPIGNDISFLLAEIVLAQVDRGLDITARRAYRWFDDFEFACDSREEAEELLSVLIRLLDTYRLRLNPKKTEILSLPQPVQDEWQHALLERGKGSLRHANDMVQYFDSAFRLREQNPQEPVLLYALGILFRLRCPSAEAAPVALSGVTQALLSEPGAAQKAFALLTFWSLNGFALDFDLLSGTISRMIEKHRAGGVSSDVSWALAFTIEHVLALDRRAAKLLETCLDDCIAIQALHAHQLGLLPDGFSPRRIERSIARADLDEEHWLLAYESFRHGFSMAAQPAIQGNPLFSSLLSKNVTFYRTRLPPYASIIHSGGAPEWILRQWLDILSGLLPDPDRLQQTRPALALLAADLNRVMRADASREEAIADLLDVLEREEFAAALADEPYF